MKNRYVSKAKISEAKFRQVVKCFALDLTATQTAEMCALNRNTANRFYSAMRARIAECARKTSPVSGEIEVDESGFGAKRVRGKRGRGAGGKTVVFGLFKRGGKTIVFGLFKRGGKVYTEIVLNVKASTLQPLSVGMPPLSQSSTVTGGAAMTAWSIWAMRSISASIMGKRVLDRRRQPYQRY